MIDFVLKLKRRWLGPKASIGELYIGDDPHKRCFTLEDVEREVKVQGETAIPCGRYQVIVNFSQRFQRSMPLLLSVPGFEGVRIHSGNTEKDTEGCILLGRILINANCIGESRAAFGDVFPMLEDASKHGKIFIEITNEPYDLGKQTI
jgi:hypothetical protein